MTPRRAEPDEPLRGFVHVHSDEELLRYRALAAEQKLEWLHAMWQFNVDFLSPRARRRHELFRHGDI